MITINTSEGFRVMTVTREPNWTRTYTIWKRTQNKRKLQDKLSNGGPRHCLVHFRQSNIELKKLQQEYNYVLLFMLQKYIRNQDIINMIMSYTNDNNQYEVIKYDLIKQEKIFKKQKNKCFILKKYNNTKYSDLHNRTSKCKNSIHQPKSKKYRRN